MSSVDKPKHQIHILKTDIEFGCREDQSILHGMGQAGRKGIPSGCHGGGCGVCKIKITSGTYVSGKMNRDVITEEEEASGYKLACKVEPRSDIALEVIGKMRRSYFGA